MEVRDLRNIREATLDLHPGLNLFVGRNAQGKTSLLEAVGLLDDPDLELDEARMLDLCREVARRGQALVTTAHPGWARGLGEMGGAFRVAEGEVIKA